MIRHRRRNITGPEKKSGMVGELAADQPGLPVSGIGGLTCATDAIEFLLMGASTVQSCTGPMLQGFDLVSELGEGLAVFLAQHGFTNVEAAIGRSLPYFTTHDHLVELQAAARAAKAAELSNRDREWGRRDFVAEAGTLVSSRGWPQAWLDFLATDEHR